MAGLREAAAAKLGAQQAQQLDALSLSMAALEAAVADLRSAGGCARNCLESAHKTLRGRIPLLLQAGGRHAA